MKFFAKTGLKDWHVFINFDLLYVVPVAYNLSSEDHSVKYGQLLTLTFTPDLAESAAAAAAALCGRRIAVY